MLLRLFYASSFLKASLKPLTRAHRTIQHFSKNTPRTKRTMSCHRSLPCLKDIKAPGEIHRSLYRDGQRRILPWNPPVRVRPLKQPRQGPLGKDGAFNIASILCLSMLFSKISGKIPRTPLRRTLPRRLDSPSTHGLALNDHSRPTQSRLRIKRVIYTIAHFSALSNAFPKIFRFFFAPAPTPHTQIRSLPYRF